MKHTIKGINSRLYDNDTEDQISDLKNKVVEITEAEQTKEKKKYIKNEERSISSRWQI